MHIATVLKVILPLALLVDGTMSTPAVHERTTGEATFQVYAHIGCGKDGKHGEETKTYQLPDGVCVDTPPSHKADAHFTSYKTKFNPGVKASSCFFDIYPYKNCTGNFSGFESAPGKPQVCENVLQGFTGETETYGAKSVRVTCRK